MLFREKNNNTFCSSISVSRLFDSKVESSLDRNNLSYTAFKSALFYPIFPEIWLRAFEVLDLKHADISV